MRIRALLCALLLVPLAQAQPVLDGFSRADGLPSDYVFAVFQDRQGFLWFGTDAGLARYDGQRVETFTTDDGLPHSLVYALAEDRAGTLYAGTYRGLARFDGQRFAAVNTGAGPAPIGTIVVDARGRVIVAAAQRGVYVGEQGRWRALAMDRLHPEQSVLALVDGRVLVSNLAGELHLLREGPEGLALDALPGMGRGLRPVHGRGGTVYVYQPGWIVRLRVDAGRAVRLDSVAIGTGSAGLRSLYAQGDDVYLSLEASTRGPGVFHVRFGARPSLVRISERWATAFTSDYEGQLWMGTFGTGARRLRARHLRTLSDAPTVRLARAPDGAVWASGQGLVRVAPGAASVARVYPESELRALMVTGPGEVVASRGPVALRLRAPFRGDAPGLGAFQEAFHDSWIAGLDVQGDTVRAASYGGGVLTFVRGRLVGVQAAGRGLPTNVIEDLVRTPSGLWMLTRTHGVLRQRGRRVDALGRADGLPSSSVFSVFEDGSGTVWIGTDRGVGRLRRGDARATPLGQDLLHGQRVTGLFVRPGAPGRVYAVGERSLYRIAGERVDVVSAFPLLPDARAAINAALYDPAADVLFLGTTRGLVVADLRALPAAPLPPPRLAVRQVVVDDRAVPLAASDAGHLALPDLPPGRHRVEVVFAPLAFSGDVRAEVRVGAGAWRSVGDERRVVLPELGPGTTRLSLRAVRLDGGAASAPVEVALRVRPFLWQRPWAWALGVLALVALSGAGVWVIGRRRLRARVRALEAEQRVQRVRERLSRDLHDHIGGQLATLVSAADLAGLAAAHGDTARALGVAASLADEAREALGQLRQTVRALQHDALSGTDLFRQIRTQAEAQLRYADRPALETHLDGPAPGAVFVDAEVGLQVLRVAQEAVTNALRHADAHTLRLTLRAEARALVLIVEDDGAGLHAGPAGDGAPPGFGLGNMRARAGEIGGTLALEDAGPGTRVRLEVPVLAA